ncbi:MAG TPA: MerR family transcriptional regulator [Noviherbaspirillum sp.]|nr:MerR family transcriptional regulator [Noviherbaspirillum sp.]
MKSIAAVERDTGLGKDTLRVWERRYGFPLPERDMKGERVYTAEQVAKLRLLKRLIDRGHRPGKIVHRDIGELQALAQGNGAMDSAEAKPPLKQELVAYLELCQLHKTEELRHNLTQAMMRAGLQRFVLDTLAPLTIAVGDYWAQGRLEVFEEHLYSEVAQNILRSGIASIPPVRTPADARPRILLTTFPQEQHALGLLMAEVMFAMEGARCVSLGVQTPIADIAWAAQGSDIVALSFSTAMNTNQVLEGLSELAAALSPQTEIWAGGESPALARCSLPAFRRVELTTVARQIALWRSERAA